MTEFNLPDNPTESDIIRVIKSCETFFHLESACEYAKLWLNRVSSHYREDDPIKDANEIVTALHEKFEELLTKGKL